MSQCPDEASKQHAESPGMVDGSEIICRGAFDPMHFNKKGQVKPAFIREAHLREGELSVWRISRTNEFGVDNAKDKIAETTPAGQNLTHLFAAKVATVRALEITIDGAAHRALCVLDDCRTDENGGYHVEHAVIALARHDNLDWTTDQEAFDMAREGLIAVFAQRAVWQAAA